jgi:peroxiredoxin
MTIRTLVRIAVTGIILSAFLVALACAVQQPGEKIKAPDINLKSPAGETVPLAAHIGKKPVLLVFWASWCTDCQDKIPLLKKLNANGFKVIAVNEGESAWKTKRFIAMNNIDYQVVLDSDGAVAKAFQVPGVPACAIISKSGFIAYRGLGLPEQINSYAEK